MTAVHWIVSHTPDGQRMEEQTDNETYARDLAYAYSMTFGSATVTGSDGTVITYKDGSIRREP